MCIGEQNGAITLLMPLLKDEEIYDEMSDNIVRKDEVTDTFEQGWTFSPESELRI